MIFDLSSLVFCLTKWSNESAVERFHLMLGYNVFLFSHCCEEISKCCNFSVQNFVDWCNQRPCFNDATCTQQAAHFQCVCRPGWTGSLCDVAMVSCAAAARDRGENVGPSIENANLFQLGST